MEKAFDRILIVMMENETQTAVLENGFMKSLAAKGVRLSKYFGVTHPSQPNYIAATAGWVVHVHNDNCMDLDTQNIIDLLEEKGVSWKAYMEDLPEDNKTICISDDRLYFRKHNPFISFNSVRNDPNRLSKIVHASRFQEDVDNNSVPQFAWYTPNIQNDGHSPPADFEPNNPLRNVDFLAQWLDGFLTPLLANQTFMQGTLVVVTFDESVPHADNNVYMILLGSMVNPNTVESERYDHYSLLRTIEENYQLGTLGRNDETAEWFRFLWNLEPPAFNWADHHQ